MLVVHKPAGGGGRFVCLTQIGPYPLNSFRCCTYLGSRYINSNLGVGRTELCPLMFSFLFYLQLINTSIIMAANSHRQLPIVDEETTEPGAHSTGAETLHGPICNDHLPFPHFQHQAGRHCQESSSSQPTMQTNITASAGHPSQGPDVSQQEAFPLGGSEISDSLESVDTREDEPGNGLRRPALDQSADHTHPTWTDFYFRPLFLISLSGLLVLMIAALEVLHRISQHNQGLVTASEDMHYVWTYGPTSGISQPAELNSF